MYTQLCAIDNGYKDTKVKTDNAIFKYSSKIYQTTDEQLAGMILEYHGVKYKIGEGQDDIELSKTKKQVHKICTLAALAKIANDDTNDFHVAVGLPLMQYKNKAFREEFKEYISSPIINTVRINSVKRNIIIKDTVVFAQGGAALYADLSKKEEYQKDLIAVIDWGGLTINGFVAENLIPIPESMFTVNLGTIILLNRIKTAINEKLALNVQDYEIPYLIKQPSKNIETIIENVQEQHFDELIKEMRKKNWSIETLKKVGVGGGFLAAGDLANKILPKLEITPDPVFANAKGLYNVGRMIWK